MHCGILRGGFRRKVRSDVIMPLPQSGEDMAGHMQRVRSGRRDGSVTSGCFQTLVRHHWIITGMEDVVCDAWMVWMLAQERIKNGHGFLGVDESYILTRVRINQGKRVENLSLQVIRIASGNFFRRLGISLGVHVKVVSCVTIEEEMHCMNVSRFTWILLSGGVGLGEGLVRPDYALRGRATVYLIEIGHRYAPIRQRTIGIGNRYLHESSLCFV